MCCVVGWGQREFGYTEPTLYRQKGNGNHGKERMVDR